MDMITPAEQQVKLLRYSLTRDCYFSTPTGFSYISTFYIQHVVIMSTIYRYDQPDSYIRLNTNCISSTAHTQLIVSDDTSPNFTNAI